MHRLTKKANLVIANRNNNVSFESLYIHHYSWYHNSSIAVILQRYNSIENITQKE